MIECASTVDISSRVRRVAFTCDFLRFAPCETGYTSFQPRNLAWLVEVLTGAGAWKHRGIQVSVVTPPQEAPFFERALGSPAALADYRLNADHAWARRYDVDEPDVFGSVFDQLCDADLVVGFEMSPTIKRQLHARGRPYLNYFVHPLRFLRDLCLGATTNSASIASALRSHQIAHGEVDAQVRRFRALFLRQKFAACAIPKGLPVLVGQTECDSVLVRDGRFFRWDDCADELSNRLAGFDSVVFLEHPYRSSSRNVVEYLRSIHGKTVIATNANSYGVIFANPDIPAVITLASSLGVEAQAAGLETCFLLDDPRRKFLVPEVDRPISPQQGAYGHGVLEAPFWDEVLKAGSSPGRSAVGSHLDSFHLGEHYLRNSLDAWSFRPLQSGVTSMTSRKALIPSGTLTSERRDALLGAMLGDAHPVPPARAIARASTLGLRLDFLDAPLILGERREVALDGPAAAAYLVHGFHPFESWGGWSSELSSKIVIPVGAEALARHAQLDISMRVRAFEGLLHRAPVMRVSSEGQLLGFVFFRATGANQQTISFTVTPSSPLCRIDLELSDLESPAEGGFSFDQRWLGFALSQFTVACHAPASGESDLDSCQVWGIGTAPVVLDGEGAPA